MVSLFPVSNPIFSIFKEPARFQMQRSRMCIARRAEHAAYGRPQIVSAVGALPDIFAEGGALLIPPRVWIRVPNMLDEHSGDLGVCDAEDFAAAMSVYFWDVERRRSDGQQAADMMRRKGCWETLLADFYTRLQNLLYV